MHVLLQSFSNIFSQKTIFVIIFSVILLHTLDSTINPNIFYLIVCTFTGSLRDIPDSSTITLFARPPMSKEK